MTVVSDVLAIARSQLGVKESPAGSNRNPYGAALGLDAELWCALFTCWVYLQAGLDTRKMLGLAVGPVSYCPAVENAAKSHAAWHIWPDIEPGDQVLYSFDGKPLAVHTGIVESVSSAGVVAIEGNTGVGNDTNGGEVMRRARDRGVILGAVRFPLEAEDMALSDDDIKRIAVATVQLLDQAATSTLAATPTTGTKFIDGVAKRSAQMLAADLAAQKQKA
jgi:hypothetical protein